MFMPLLYQLKGFGFIFHSLPFEELLSLRLATDAVQDGAQDQQEAKEARGRDGVTVCDTRQGNAQQDARRHDERKDDGAKVLWLVC
jgi:hypothetical protein